MFSVSRIFIIGCVAVCIVCFLPAETGEIDEAFHRLVYTTSSRRGGNYCEQAWTQCIRGMFFHMILCYYIY